MERFTYERVICYPFRISLCIGEAIKIMNGFTTIALYKKHDLCCNNQKMASKESQFVQKKSIC